MVTSLTNSHIWNITFRVSASDEWQSSFSTAHYRLFSATKRWWASSWIKICCQLRGVRDEVTTPLTTFGFCSTSLVSWSYCGSGGVPNKWTFVNYGAEVLPATEATVKALKGMSLEVFCMWGHVHAGKHKQLNTFTLTLYTVFTVCQDGVD